MIFALLLATTALAITTFNRLVDPFWYYRDFKIDGLNSIKTKFRRYERHVKPSIVQREQPASLIFGSSFSEIGFDPLHPSLNNQGKGYNFALAGTSWDMVLCSVQFALEHDYNLKKIILGISPYQMPDSCCQDDVADMEHPDIKAFLFSMDALLASINTVAEQSTGKPSHTKEGMYFYCKETPGTLDRFREYLPAHLPCARENLKSLNSDTVLVSGRVKYQQEHPDLSGLKKVIKATVKKGIELKLVVYPGHAMTIELEYMCGTRRERWEMLKQIAYLVKGEGEGLVQLWDFEGYHSIGTENITKQPGHYWQDPVHFNYEFGNVILDEMYGLKPVKFGRLLTPDTIEESFTDEQVEREKFLSENPLFPDQLFNLIN